MTTDESHTMYDNPLAELLMFLLDFTLFCAKSIYYFLETFILTILPDRYREFKVSELRNGIMTYISRN